MRMIRVHKDVAGLLEGYERILISYWKEQHILGFNISSVACLRSDSRP